MTETFVYPQPRTCPYHPSSAYDGLRAGPPLQRVPIASGARPWIVSGYAQARALLADPRVSADRTRAGYPIIAPPGVTTLQRGPNRPFIAMDDPEHARVRRMLISEFTVRRFKELRPDIEKIVHDAIDDLLAAGSPADLVSHVSLPVPSLVISGCSGCRTPTTSSSNGRRGRWSSPVARRRVRRRCSGSSVTSRSWPPTRRPG